MINKITTLILLISLNFISFATSVNAEELVVSDNGANSQNNINVSQNSSTNVSQDNTASVENNVDTSANTGNNSASDNSGNTQVTTGDATNAVSAETAVNASTATVGCCPDGGTSATISGNGQGSVSNIDVNSNSQTNVNVYQNATISTNIQGYVNTGHNSANDNFGDVSIETGNIYANGQVQNATNFASVSAASGNPAVKVKIADNARDSENSIYLNLNNNVNVSIDNNSRLYNTLNWDLNTGWNEANDNDGNVRIKTGDIRLDIIIQNLANISKVIVDCNCEVKAKENSPSEEENNSDDSGDSDDNDSDSGDSDNGGGSGGTDEGDVLGEELPVTGDNAMIGLTLIAMIMIASGLYLRQSSSSYKKSAYYPRFRYNTLRLV